jgi:hypothetical protein
MILSDTDRPNRPRLGDYLDFYRAKQGGPTPPSILPHSGDAGTIPISRNNSHCVFFIFFRHEYSALSNQSPNASAIRPFDAASR